AVGQGEDERVVLVVDAVGHRTVDRVVVRLHHGALRGEQLVGGGAGDQVAAVGAEQIAVEGAVRIGELEGRLSEPHQDALGHRTTVLGVGAARRMSGHLARRVLPSHARRCRIAERTGAQSLTGAYRSTCAPEARSNLSCSTRSLGSGSPSKIHGPWPAIRGWTTNSYSSMRSRAARARGSVTPPVRISPPGASLRSPTAVARSPRTSCAFQSTVSKVEETTCFGIGSMTSAKGVIQSGKRPGGSGRRQASSIIR